MEQDGRGNSSEGDAPGTGGGSVTRGQNVVYVLPHDWAAITHVVGPLLDRLDASAPGPQLVVITSEPEVTAAVGAALVRLADQRELDIVSATSSRRAGRLWRTRPAPILAGDPQTLVDLVRAAALKLEHVRVIAILWVDELLAAGCAEHLETLMAELPKDAPRIIVSAELTKPVEEVMERYARRARRVIAPPPAEERAIPIEFVTVSPSSRLAALRRLLDDLDPRSALVFTRAEDSTTPVRDLLRALGYAGADAAIRSGLTAPPETETVVLYDLPASREELREAAGPSSKRIVALVQPRQLTSLRALAGGGGVTPFILPGAAERARGRDATTRGELRAALTAGEFGRELLTLEPLLDEYDGIEIAAAALQLLERERVARAAARVAEPRADSSRSTTGTGAGSMVRLFVTVGSRDNVRPGDLVGAITNAAGITGSEVGKVDVRESHSTVEVAEAVAEVVVEKLTGTMIKGRRAIARVDKERPRRSPDERGSSRPPARGRGPREQGGARGERSDRFGKGDRTPRGAPRRRDRE